jgi:tetraacyldisaccharide 4'-kinase
MTIAGIKIWRRLRFLLLPFSLIYWLVVSLRNLFYDFGIFRIKALPRPVISVGNITAGGTGKTPMVEWIAKFLSQMGKKVAILSRGYGRRTKGFVLVSDGKKIFSEADECGDEPFQMALKSVENGLNWVIAVCEDRFEAGRKLLEKFEIDLFILDDAFQRRDINRDVDILLVDDESVKEFLIPAGLKREPMSSLKRANVVCVQGLEGWRVLERYIRDENVVRCVFGYKLLEIRKFFDYILLEKPFEGKKVVAFSGIGKHKNFLKLLKDNKFLVLKDFEFPDHYRYDRDDIKEIIRQMELVGAEIVLTTEKDYARLYEMKDLKDFPFFYSVIEVEFYSGGEELKQKILGLVG